MRLALHVSSGTYIRAIAEALGGHCTTLRRTAVGPFDVGEAGPGRGREAHVGRRRTRALGEAARATVPVGIRATVLALEDEA